MATISSRRTAALSMTSIRRGPEVVPRVLGKPHGLGQQVVLGLEVVDDQRGAGADLLGHIGDSSFGKPPLGDDLEGGLQHELAALVGRPDPARADVLISCHDHLPGGGVAPPARPRPAGTRAEPIVLSPRYQRPRLNNQSNGFRRLSGVRPRSTRRGSDDLDVRRDRGGRWTQRVGGGCVSGPIRRPDPGPRGEVQDRRCGHHRDALARRSRVQGHPALLCDEPAAPDHHAGPRPGAARLQGLSDGPLLPGLP